MEQGDFATAFWAEIADFSFVRRPTGYEVDRLYSSADLSGKPLRNVWGGVIREPDCWPQRYREHFAAISAGRRLRLPMHEKLLDVLALRVMKRAYAAARLRSIERNVLGDPVVVFSRLDPECPRAKRRITKFDFLDGAWRTLYPPCERLDCGCTMYLADARGAASLKTL